MVTQQSRAVSSEPIPEAVPAEPSPEACPWARWAQPVPGWAGQGRREGVRGAGTRHLLHRCLRRTLQRQSRVRTQCRHGDRSMAPGTPRARGQRAPRRANLRQPPNTLRAAGRTRRAATRAPPCLGRHAIFYA